MSDLESDLVERKESAADGRHVRRNVCAFDSGPVAGAGDADHRNPLLAEIMANLGFAQRFGLGVPNRAHPKLPQNNAIQPLRHGKDPRPPTRTALPHTPKQMFGI